MSVHIGAEIEDVDLTQPLLAGTVSEIRQALLKWKVVFSETSISIISSRFSLRAILAL